MSERLVASPDDIRESLSRMQVVTDMDRECLVLEATDAVNSPDFANAGRVHDWRNYVPGWAKQSWGVIAVDARVVMFLMADVAAGNEDWD